MICMGIVVYMVNTKTEEPDILLDDTTWQLNL